MQWRQRNAPKSVIMHIRSCFAFLTFSLPLSLLKVPIVTSLRTAIITYENTGRATSCAACSWSSAFESKQFVGLFMWFIKLKSHHLPTWQCTDILRRNYTLVNTHIICVFYSQDLLSQVMQVIECRLRCDGINQHKALTILHV